MNKKQEVTVIDADSNRHTRADLNDAAENTTTLAHLKVYAGLTQKLEIDLTASIDAKWGAARLHTEIGNAHWAAFGLLLLNIKDEMAHGAFLPELERRGFEERAAQRAMVYARYVFTQPEQLQARLLEMPVSKVAVLAQADPEVVEVLLEDGDTVETTTVRGLIQMWRREKDAKAKLQTALNDSEKHAAALAKTKRLSAFSAKTQAVRDETLVLQGQIEYGASALKRMWDDALGDALDATERAARTEFIWFAAHAVTARMGDLLRDMQESAPAGTSAEATMAHALTPDEARHWGDEWATITAHLKAAELVRHERRKQDHPQDVGRPAAAPLAGGKKSGRG